MVDELTQLLVMLMMHWLLNCSMTARNRFNYGDQLQ